MIDGSAYQQCMDHAGDPRPQRGKVVLTTGKVALTTGVHKGVGHFRSRIPHYKRDRDPPEGQLRIPWRYQGMLV
jgi:hypothetical protein